jgi:hypothetical protein
MSEQKGALKVALTAATTTAVGGVLKLVNPEGADVIVKRFTLDVTTASTGAATVDAGIDTDGTTSSDTLLDGLDVNAAAGVFDNIDDQGTNGQATVKWPAGEYLVITASATVAGLVGNAYIEYDRV